jgi:hypothetical protein
MKNEEGLDRLGAVVGLYYVFIILEGQVHTTQDRLRQVTQNRNGNPELGIFRRAQAVLFLWAMELVEPSLDLPMSVWGQIHKSSENLVPYQERPCSPARPPPSET